MRTARTCAHRELFVWAVDDTIRFSNPDEEWSKGPAPSTAPRQTKVYFDRIKISRLASQPSSNPRQRQKVGRWVHRRERTILLQKLDRTPHTTAHRAQDEKAFLDIFVQLASAAQQRDLATTQIQFGRSDRCPSPELNDILDRPLVDQQLRGPTSAQ